MIMKSSENMFDAYGIFICCGSTHNDGSPFFPETFLFSVEGKEGVLQIEKLYVQVRRRRKDTCVLVCLFTAFQNRNLMVCPPYSLFCLIIDSSLCVCVCVFTRLSFKLWVLFHTVFGFVLPMDWKSDRRGSESSQAVVGKGYRGDFDFKGSFLKFPLNLSVFACQVFLSSLFFFKKK